MGYRRWSVRFLDEGKGFLRVWRSGEVGPGSGFGYPSLHHHSFFLLLTGVLYALSHFLDVRSWVPAPFCSRYPLVRFVECSVKAPCWSLVRGGCRLQYALDAVLQWIVVTGHEFVGHGDVKATG